MWFYVSLEARFICIVVSKFEHFIGLVSLDMIFQVSTVRIKGTLKLTNRSMSRLPRALPKNPPCLEFQPRLTCGVGMVQMAVPLTWSFPASVPSTGHILLSSKLGVCVWCYGVYIICFPRRQGSSHRRHNGCCCIVRNVT